MVLASGSSVWAQTPSTTTPPAPQPASAPATAQPQAYVDQVIDEKAAQEDKVFAGDSDEAGGGSGLRSLGVDYKYYTVDRADQGVSLEQGVALRYRQETANYGEFFLDSEFRTLDPANGEILVAPRNGGRITLYQNHFALSESLLADNAVGVVRGNSSSLISSTFRRTLPGSLLGGVTSTIYDQDRELRLSLGEIGTLNGIASQQFNTSSGRLAGLGYTSHLGSNWSGGAQFWDLQGNDEVADHQSLALAAEYLTPNNDARYQIHTLLDSKGHNGVWLDGQNQINLWQQRYGVYRLDPGLLWNDVTIANDEQGAYWRADYLSSRYTLSGGLETRENNINDNPVTVGTRTTLGFVSGSRRLSRLNTVGGLFSASDTQQISGPPSNDHQDYVANAYLSHRFGFGLSRFQISRNQTSSDVSPSHTDAFTWDHEWAGLGRLQLSTRLGYERDSTTAGNAGRFTGGLTMHSDG